MEALTTVNKRKFKTRAFGSENTHKLYFQANYSKMVDLKITTNDSENRRADGGGLRDQQNFNKTRGFL